MSKKLSSDEYLIGAHTSIAGGPYNALIEGKVIGATTIQMFTANQRQWKAKPLTGEAIDLFKMTLKETHLKKIMSHSSYLINLGSPDQEMLEKSRKAFGEEIERCQQLGISYLNFHPGASKDSSREECMERIIESILFYEDRLIDDSLILLLESTAGQGSSIGSKFEELAYILEGVKKRVPIGVCIDTCHIFAAGYDIRSPTGWRETLALFDKLIGLNKLYAFHLNDSAMDLGSFRDRHAHLGKGKIGIDSFKFLMSNPLTSLIPKYLETPDGPSEWVKEIDMLRQFTEKNDN